MANQSPQQTSANAGDSVQFHEKMMARCLELAAGGLGRVAPNPMVGAVITHNDKIIGQGFHQAFGGPHAEVLAIESVQEKHLLPQSRLYVNLEPCCHFGKTPPCSDLIIRSQIPEVIIGCQDVYKEVAGKGISQLQQAGIKVSCGILEQDCLELNKRFFTFHKLNRPYIILKWAETKDGFIAREDATSKWISSEASRILVHKWRSEEPAIMIGTNTALFDNPQLTVRHVAGINPLRVVVDRTLRLPADLHLFDGSVRTLVFNEECSVQKSDKLEYQQIGFNENMLSNVMSALHQRNILSCIVEGGARLLNSFLNNDLWDEARVFVSPKTFGMGLRSPFLKRKDYQASSIGTDELRVFRNKRN